MTVLTLDSATAERLKAMHGEVQLCDPQGVIVGRAIAVGETPPCEVPFTREELEASEMQAGGCTLEEFLPLLEKLRAAGAKPEEVAAEVSRACEESARTLRTPGGKTLGERQEITSPFSARKKRA